MNDTANEPVRDTGLPVQSSDAEEESHLVAGPEAGSLHAEMQVAISRHSGPLPSPQTLQEYEIVVPGSAERFLVAFEKEAAHRHSLEWATEVTAVRRGQWFAFVLSLIALGAGVFVIYLNYPVEGLVGVLLAMGTLVGVFILGRRNQEHRVSETRTLPEFSPPVPRDLDEKPNPLD